MGGGTNESGLYTLNLGDNEGEFEVYCDMNPGLFGGGWTTIMRRGPNEPLDLFYKDWKAYQTGFGTFHGSFWMGLEKIHRITTSDNYELYLGFEDVLGFTAWARYSTFSIGDENSKYLLTVGGYEGTAGDSLRDHNDHMFSTKDQDNDTINETHCAQVFHGGWWFENMACHDSNLNGRYYENGITPTGKDDGISWHSWRGPDMSITKVVMALRPTA